MSEIRCLGAADALIFRALRLEALEHHPEAFGASLADERLGFVAYGTEPHALKLGDRYVDEVLMVRRPL